MSAAAGVFRSATVEAAAGSGRQAADARQIDETRRQPLPRRGRIGSFVATAFDGAADPAATEQVAA